MGEGSSEAREFTGRQILPEADRLLEYGDKKNGLRSSWGFNVR